jgi:general stress protein 26
VDDIGQIWLLVSRPQQNIKEFEQRFPVTLNFYRKGKDFYLNVTGKATIVLEPGEIDEMVENMESDGNHVPDHWMLVKIEIIATEYHDNSMRVKNSWISALTSQVNKWISSPSNDYKPLAIH